MISLAARLEAKDVRNGTIEWRCGSNLLPKLDDTPRKPPNLQWLAALDVVMH